MTQFEKLWRHLYCFDEEGGRRCLYVNTNRFEIDDITSAEMRARLIRAKPYMNLSEKEEFIWQEVYIKNGTYANLARLLKISRNTASYKVRKLRSKLWYNPIVVYLGLINSDTKVPEDFIDIMRDDRIDIRAVHRRGDWVWRRLIISDCYRVSDLAKSSYEELAPDNKRTYQKIYNLFRKYHLYHDNVNNFINTIEIEKRDEMTQIERFWLRCYKPNESFPIIPSTAKERLVRAKEFIELTEKEEIVWEELLMHNKPRSQVSSMLGYKDEQEVTEILCAISNKFVHDTVIRTIWLRKPNSKIPNQVAYKWINGDVNIRNLDINDTQANHMRYNGFYKISHFRDVDINFFEHTPIIIDGKMANYTILPPNSVKNWYDRVHRILDTIGIEEGGGE